MVPVPSYQVLEFSEWLHSRGIRIRPEEIEREKLRELASEFLRRRKGGFPEQEPTFRHLLWVFQECPKIRETDLKEQFEHFVQCRGCIPYIDTTDHKGRMVCTTSLHPILRRFIRYVDGTGLIKRVNNYTVKGHNDSKFRYYLGDWLRRVLLKEGYEIHDRFAQFVDDLDRGQVNDFLDYKRQDHNEHIDQDKIIEDGAKPIDYDNIGRESDRLLHSFEQFIKGEISGDINPSDPTFHKALRLLTDVPERLAQSLEFVEWIYKNYPDISLGGDIPSSEIDSLVVSFCNELGYDNAEAFKHEVKKWIRGEDSSNILSRIKWFIRNREINRKGHSSLGSIFERYKSVDLHGIFLFLSHGNASNFIDEYWRDLNALTSDYIDIYYNREDLNNRVSGYDILAEFQKLEVDYDQLPALVLWKEDLKNARAIYLDDLENHSIFEVVQIVVKGVRNEKKLNSITDEASKIVSSYQKHENIPERSIRNIFDIKIEGGVYKMIDEGDEYNVSGQAGAVGRNASAQDMDFDQIWNEVSEDADLSELSSDLKRLRSALDQEAESEEDRRTLQKVADAQSSAENDNGRAAIQHLAEAGEWSLKVAEDIGTTVAAAAIKAALGM